MMEAAVVRNCDSGTILLCAVAFLGSVHFLKRKRSSNFPPGPKGLPIVGYAPFLGDNAAETMRKMKSKYGPVMSIRMGMEDWVVLNDYETINEAIVRQSNKFSGRPRNHIMEIVTDGCGVASLDYGSTWQNLRKFGMKTMRGLGFGKKRMEDDIEDVMKCLIENLLKDDREPVHMKMTLATASVISRFVFGSKFTCSDKRFLDLVRLLRDFLKDTRLFGSMMLAPVLRYFPPFRGEFRRIMADVENFLGILREIVQEHEACFDENDIRDFIDAFLKETKERGTNDLSFCEKQLFHYIRDLFGAGTGTTGTTLTWAMLCFLNFPECQEKIAKEVEQMIGPSEIPLMEHRHQMPYTCSFIQELTRYRTVAPFAIFHKTNEQATLRGYTIPENTTILVNLCAAHMDAKIFENPEEFRPERFLDEGGTFIESKHVIPFSIGPRHCLGKQLAKTELFVFLTGIVQKLKILPDPIRPPPPFNGGRFHMVTLEPPKFTVRFERRIIP